jgi:hypothetical protein
MAVIAYDDARSGETYVLLIQQSLHFEEVDHCLLCPMPLRLIDVAFNERPKSLTTDPTNNDQSIIWEKLLAPLSIEGVTFYFPARKPTMEEYVTCKRIELTYPDPGWKPTDVIYSEEESRFINNDEMIRIQDRTVFGYELHDEEGFIKEFKSMLRVESQDGCKISPLTSDREFRMSAESLSQTSEIGISAA